MPIVLANISKAKLLQQKIPYLNGLQLHLFVNNITPDGTFNVAAFQEPTDGGYHPVSPPLNFQPAYLNGQAKGETDGLPITWTFTFSTGAFVVYGYFLTDQANGNLVYSERATTPFSVTGAGQTYTVTLVMLEDTM